MMKMSQQEIESLAEEALDAACLLIQNKVGQTDGGLASIVFSDDEVQRRFMDYIRIELTSRELDREIELARPNLGDLIVEACQAEVGAAP